MKNETEAQRKPILIGGIILAVLVAAGLGFLYYWISELSYVSTDDAAVTGYQVAVSAKMLGRIRDLLADEGAKVAAGQLLVRLDDTDLRAQEAQAVTALNSARENLVLAKVNLDKTRQDFGRSKALLDTGVIPREQYDHAVKAVDAAQAQYAIARTQIDSSQAQLGVVRTQLANTQIVAPLAGTIAKRSALPGEIVQAGQAIFTINDLRHVWISANFEETKIRLIHLQQAAAITVDAYPGQPLAGRVVQIGANIIPPPFQIGDTTKTTQKIPVKIALGSVPDATPLVPGMSVEIKIKVK